jgi:hypothetical protein
MLRPLSFVLSLALPLGSYVVLAMSACGDDGHKEPPKITGGWETFVRYEPSRYNNCTFGLYLDPAGGYAASYTCELPSSNGTHVIQSEVGTYSTTHDLLTLASQRSSCSRAGSTIQTYAYAMTANAWSMTLKVAARGDGGFPFVTVDAAGHLQLSGHNGMFDLDHYGGGPFRKEGNRFGCFSASGVFTDSVGELNTGDIELIYKGYEG